MSQGAFVKSRYEFTTGSTPGLTETPICPITVQPETIGLTIGGASNDPPVGGTNIDVSASVSKGKRQYGIGPRKVSLRFTGTLPAGYTGDNVIVPILTNSFFNSISTGDTGTYLGADVAVASKIKQELT